MIIGYPKMMCKNTPQKCRKSSPKAPLNGVHFGAKNPSCKEMGRRQPPKGIRIVFWHDFASLWVSFGYLLGTQEPQGRSSQWLHFGILWVRFWGTSKRPWDALRQTVGLQQDKVFEPDPRSEALSTRLFEPDPRSEALSSRLEPG